MNERDKVKTKIIALLAKTEDAGASEYEADFYTVPALAEKLGCSDQTIYLFLQTGQIQASVLSKGWWIEYGVVEEHNKEPIFIPYDYKQFSKVLIGLDQLTTMKIINNGILKNPCLGLDPIKKSSYAWISEHHHPDGITVTTNDILISKKHEELFSGTSTAKRLSSQPDINISRGVSGGSDKKEIC